MKVLICNNSSNPSGDFRVDWSFQELISKGDVSSFLILPFGDAKSEMRKRFLSELTQRVEDYKPDVIIWHKDDGSDLGEETVKRVATQSILVYHDLDPWMKFIKPVRANQHLLSKYAHRVFLCGLGAMADLFPMAGNRIRYSHDGYYDVDVPPEMEAKRPHLVFIGSVHRRAKKLFGPFAPEQHPGRTKAVGILRRRLGDSFEVYGKGYPASWGIEPCAFDRQFDLINQNLASFSIDAAPKASFYFSNRTPFSMACGSIHLKIRREGDETQFAGCPGLISVANANEAADAFQQLLSDGEQRQKELSRGIRDFARKHFRAPDLYRKILLEATSS